MEATMKTLLLNAHPDNNNPNSFTFALKEEFLKHYNLMFPENEIDVLNLYDEEIPTLSHTELTGVWKKQENDEILTQSESIIAIQSEKLLKQFKISDHIIIATPLHNFNISSRLKDYIDNILIAKHTFKYTESGESVGLMQNHKCLVLQSSGCVYTDQSSIYANMDFAKQYLETMFKNIMDFDDFKIIRAEGTDFMERSVILEKSKIEIQNYMSKFYQ